MGCMTCMIMVQVAGTDNEVVANISAAWEDHLVIKVDTMLNIVPLFPGRVFWGKALPLNQDHSGWW